MSLCCYLLVMKSLILTLFAVLNFYILNAKADTGIVTVQSQYQDVSIPNLSVKYEGRGFVVDYPVKSESTNKDVILKVVLTAAHLVFGGIAEERLDNYKLYNSDTNQEIFALGMISDVVHDSAALILCTQENMEFLESEFKAKGIDLSNLMNLDGQIFTEGGGCVSKGNGGVVLDNISSYARYVGEPMVINSQNNKGFLLSDRSLGSARIVVNQNAGVKYITGGRTQAVPWINSDGLNSELVESANDLSVYLNPIDRAIYDSMSEVPREYSVPFSLEAGYSGSPIVSFDPESNDLVVNGIYKASTQADEDDSYGNMGWVSPVEISQGLINVLLNRYFQNLHRWNTVPQAYLHLENRNLIRSFVYNQFFLFEGTDYSPPEVDTDLNSEGWVRSDTGHEMWIRTDTGSAISTHPQKSKQLHRMISDGNVTYQDIVSGIVLIDENNQMTVLPPVLSSAIYISKFNCESCVNSTYNEGVEIIWVTQEDLGNLGGAIWESLNPNNNNLVIKNFINSNLNKKIKNMNVSYTLLDDRLKVELIWEEDSLVFYVLLNNSIFYQNQNDQWKEEKFLSVLETKTTKGDIAILETAGVIYFNTELPNPKSFRIKISNQETQLFEQK